MELKLKSFTKVEKREDSKLRGYASVTIDDCFAVESIRLLEGVKGLYLGFPSREYVTKEGETVHKDTCDPVNPETRKQYEDLMFAEYNKSE